MFGRAEPAGDQIVEEAVVFTHRLEEEEEASPSSLKHVQTSAKLRFKLSLNRNLLHEVLVRHHFELLGRRFGHGHQEDVDAELSRQHGRLLQVVGRPAVNQHQHHTGVAPPPAVLLVEEGLGRVRDGFTCTRTTTRRQSSWTTVAGGSSCWTPQRFRVSCCQYSSRRENTTELMFPSGCKRAHEKRLNQRRYPETHSNWTEASVHVCDRGGAQKNVPVSTFIDI